MDFRSNNAGDENKPDTAGQRRNRAEIIGLVKKAVDGDFEAFGKLHTICIVPIYRYVLYQVRDKMTAEDITEEVFLKAWRAIGSCRGKEATFSSWLYRIAHNQVIDTLRRQQKQVPLEMTALADVQAPLDLDVKLEQQQLLKAIIRLPPNQKQVIILKFIEGLNNDEIGQIMGKNQGAIRILQMRALATLRFIMSQGR